MSGRAATQPSRYGGAALTCRPSALEPPPPPRRGSTVQTAATKRKQALSSAQLAQELRDKARKAIKALEEAAKKA